MFQRLWTQNSVYLHNLYLFKRTLNFLSHSPFKIEFVWDSVVMDWIFISVTTIKFGYESKLEHFGTEF